MGSDNFISCFNIANETGRKVNFTSTLLQYTCASDHSYTKRRNRLTVQAKLIKITDTLDNNNEHF